jgi:hypothetical protein
MFAPVLERYMESLRLSVFYKLNPKHSMYNWALNSFKQIYTVTCMEWLSTGFGLVIGFIEFLQHVTTNTITTTVWVIHSKFHCNYSTHKVFSVLLSRCSVAALNIVHPPYTGFPNCPRPQLPASHSNSSQRLSTSSYLTHSSTNTLHSTDWLKSKRVLLITFRRGPRRKRRSSVTFASVGMPAWSPLSHCLAMAVA